MRGVCPLKASWKLPSIETGVICMILEGVVRVKMCVGHVSAALPRIILRSRLLTHTPPRRVKDTFPYLRIPLITLFDLTPRENVEECIFKFRGREEGRRKSK